MVSGINKIQTRGPEREGEEREEIAVWNLALHLLEESETP
jgi:hypothetical protein